MIPQRPPETPLHTHPGTPGPQLRPPDFMLPKSERHADRSGGAKAGLYVSSGGQTYGPSTPREVVASVRTGYFNEDAVFWVESRNEWRPLTELAQHVELPPPSVEPAHLELPPRIPLHAPPTQAVTPKWPGAGDLPPLQLPLPPRPAAKGGGVIARDARANRQRDDWPGGSSCSGSSCSPS